MTDAVANPFRSIELDVDIGADARDWSSIQAQEKLKPVETELRRIEEMVAEVVNEMEYLRSREQKLRDTNESTNERVKWFAFGTMGMLIGLGAWQVVYLRAYFRFVSPPLRFFFFNAGGGGIRWLTSFFFFFFLRQIQASYLDGYIRSSNGLVCRPVYVRVWTIICLDDNFFSVIISLVYDKMGFVQNSLNTYTYK